MAGAGVLIPSNQSLSETRTDMSHQTTTDHGLHNPLVYVSIEKNNYVSIY